MSNRYALAAAILASLARLRLWSVRSAGVRPRRRRPPAPTPARATPRRRRGPEGRDHRQRQMKFIVIEIRAKAGERLSVTLVNKGTTPKFSMGHNWVLLGARRQRRDLPRRRGRSPDDRIRAGCATGRHSRRHEAPRARRARHRDVRGPDRARPLSVHLFVPRPRPGRHAWRADRRVSRPTSDWIPS